MSDHDVERMLRDPEGYGREMGAKITREAYGAALSGQRHPEPDRTWTVGPSWDPDEDETAPWCAVVAHWPGEEPAGPGAAPEHWTWELVEPIAGMVALDGCSLDDPSPVLASIVDHLNAAAPGSDPAPKVGDRVQQEGEAPGTVLDVEQGAVQVRVLWEDANGDAGEWIDLDEFDALGIAVVPGAPVGVSETEGDQSDPEPEEDEKVVDVMRALEESIERAKEARERKRVEREAAQPEHRGHGEGVERLIGTVPGCPACDAQTTAVQGRAMGEFFDAVTDGAAGSDQDGERGLDSAAEIPSSGHQDGERR